MATAVKQKQGKRQGGGAGRPGGRSDAPARLIAAAGELMAASGSTDVTLEDIARQSGLNGALVKYHFGSKTGLLVALLERDAREAVGQLSALVDSPLPPVEKLKLHITGIVNAYYRSPYLNRLIHDLLYQNDAPVAQQVSDFFVTPVVEFQRKLLKQGERSGDFRAVDPMLFYFTVFGAIDHMFHARHTLLYGFRIKRVSDRMRQELIALVTDMVLGGVLKKQK